MRRTLGATFVSLSLNGALGTLEAQIPKLRVLDSIALEESGNRFIARAAALSVSGDGSIFVSDNSNKFVLSYTRGGRFIRQFGKRGSGPGELESAVQIALDGDSLLVVNNQSRLRLDAYDVKTGAHRFGVALPRRASTITASGGILRASSVAMGDRASMVQVNRGRGTPVIQGPLPELLQRFPILAGPFGTVTHDARGDHIVSAFEVSDFVYFWDSRGKVDSVRVPVVQRRGAQQDLLQRAARDTSRGREALFRSSIPMAVAWIGDSAVAVVHGDVELKGNLFEGRFFLSVVHLRTRKVCADRVVPVPSDPFPRFAIRDGVLFALVQHVPDTGEPGTYVLKMPLAFSCA